MMVIAGKKARFILEQPSGSSFQNQPRFMQLRSQLNVSVLALQA